MALELDIEVPRNGHYFEAWQLTDVGGDPISLIGHTITMSARAMAGSGAIVASADIDIDAGADGTFTVKWTGADFDTFPGATEIVRLAYDMKDTGPDGITKLVVRGQIILFPEVTE